ncbi:uroporphyrinogen-III synthase [Salisaeta longa]|uniref:uroporphyrinogen-III synthase n=1 Tax=Salisaeta longa TaxID=503170 RepID=UPI0003B5F98E|nr:uroporphyrinogen-III synthase [Salisaeta longa]
MPHVALLRSAASSTSDPYVQAFAQDGWTASCHPVLRFTFPQQEALEAELARAARYGALLVTSPRAVRALEQAWEGQAPSAWRAKPAYAVGPKTAQALRALGLRPVGHDAGSARQLASRLKATDAPFLFLCGNRRRDTLPNALREQGLSYTEQVVYHTHLRTDVTLPDTVDWIAVFSPSGRKALAASGIDPSAYQIAAIGPTTAAALREASCTVAAVAASPSPAALQQAVGAAEAKR